MCGRGDRRRRNGGCRCGRCRLRGRWNSRSCCVALGHCRSVMFSREVEGRYHQEDRGSGGNQDQRRGVRLGALFGPGRRGCNLRHRGRLGRHNTGDLWRGNLRRWRTPPNFPPRQHSGRNSTRQDFTGGSNSGGNAFRLNRARNLVRWRRTRDSRSCRDLTRRNLTCRNHVRQRGAGRGRTRRSRTRGSRTFRSLTFRDRRCRILTRHERTRQNLKGRNPAGLCARSLRSPRARDVKNDGRAFAAR